MRLGDKIVLDQTRFVTVDVIARFMAYGETPEVADEALARELLDREMVAAAEPSRHRYDYDMMCWWTDVLAFSWKDVERALAR